MSLVNQMLKDLDRQGKAAPLPAGVQAAGGMEGRPGGRIWLPAALLLLLAAGAYWFWPEGQAPRPASSPPDRTAAMPPPATQATAPAPTAAASAPTMAPTPAPAASGPAPARPPAVATDQLAPAVATALMATAPTLPLASKLDSTLSKIAPAPAVIKAQRPPSAAEQAEETYHHALRLVERGQGREAANVLATVLRLDPDHLGARQAGVALALEQGDQAKAEALLQEGLALHRNELWFNKSLGQMRARAGNYAQAAEALRAGIGKPGVDAAYLGLTGGVLARAHMHAEAVRVYTDALRASPGQGPWWIGLGLSQEQLGHRDEAVNAFRQARQTRLNAELASFVNQKLTELAGPKPPLE